MITHLIKASHHEADIIHFPETSLSGYETNSDVLNWVLLDRSMNRIKDAAKAYHMYVVFGSHYASNSRHKPYNCTFVISKTGQRLGIYYKTKLYRNEHTRFSRKDNFLVQQIHGIRCGFLICYDSCFPELFQEYRKRGVQFLFLSYYNAKSTKGKNSLDALMEAQLRTRAADHGMYISGSNSSTRYSRMPSSVASPDGNLARLPRHKTGILLYDYPQPSLGWTYDNRT